MSFQWTTKYYAKFSIWEEIENFPWQIPKKCQFFKKVTGANSNIDLITGFKKFHGKKTTVHGGEGKEGDEVGSRRNKNP